MVAPVITISQRKGGVGKITLAVQLAVAWARCGERVAALDIDYQSGWPPPRYQRRSDQRQCFRRAANAAALGSAQPMNAAARLA